MTQFDSMTDQSSLETEIQHKPVNEQSTDSQALKGKLYYSYKYMCMKNTAILMVSDKQISRLDSQLDMAIR